MQSGTDSTSISEPRRVAVRDSELTVLYTPPEDPVIADLIFVHGLQGHPRKTWQSTTEAPLKKQSLFGLITRKRGREEYEESSDATFWPADLLPDDYKNIRILTYGYDSHVSHYFKGPANKLNLSQLGEGLLNRVVGERRRSKVSGRPIMFVAHSLGGLLVKEALVESKKQGHGSNKMDVYKSTQGIIFFGTPHKGSNDAKWGMILKAIASAAFDTNDKILRALEPDSELLDKLARDFQDIVDEGKLKICSLLESAGKTGLPIFNGKVVPDFSASFGSRKFEHQDYIEKNHMNMCRFAGKEDAGYNRFRDGLEFCVEALEILNVENTREGLLHSLKFDAMLSREAQLADVPATTLDWIWDLPTGPSSLAQWLSTKAGVFWIQGKPGSGKSTLMSYLKGHSQTKLHLAKVSDQNWVIVRFFFDFRARMGVSNSFDGLLRAILFQLALEIPDLSPSVAKFGIVDTLQPNTQQELCWTVPKLREALLSTLLTCNTNILMLIDGLDEFEGASRIMLDMIEFFQELASLEMNRSLIKICIASRPDPLIFTAFGASSGFRLQDYNNNGIESYVNCRLKIIAKDPDILAYLESRLFQFAEMITKRSRGVFLWARFATDELLEGVADGDELDELWTRLQALPDELEAIYARIINRIIQKCGGSQETSIILQIAYFTLRSLSLQEFFVIFQLSMRRKNSDESRSLAAFKKRLRAKAGGLVEVVGKTKSEVKLMHETVRAYLDRLSGGSGRPFADSSNDAVFMKQSVLGDISESERWGASNPSRYPTIVPIRACIRCRLQNRSCSIGSPCIPCLKVKVQQPIFICFRSSLSQCSLSRETRTPLDWPELLPASEHFTITNQARASKGNGSLTVQLSRFYGAPLKLSIRGFVLGEKPEVSPSELIGFNALGIEDLGQAIIAAETCVKESFRACISTKVGDEDQIAATCFKAALDMANHPESGELIQQALRLWVATRGLEDNWRISSAQFTNGWNDFNDRVLLTPILRYQLETILQVQIIKPLERKTLQDLDKFFHVYRKGSQLYQYRTENWLALFLIIFILLHNCDLIVAEHKLLHRTAQNRYSNKRHLYNVEHTGKILLSYFHHSCKGFRKFSGNSRDWLRNSLQVELHPATKRLILSIVGALPEVDKQRGKYSSLEEYDGQSWFRGQMFVSDWVPSRPIVDMGASVESDSAGGEHINFPPSISV